MLPTPLLPLALALLQAPGGPPSPPAAGDPAAAGEEALARATPEARALWERVGRATRASEGTLAPLQAFVLEAEVLTRDGVQTNEMRIEYRFLAPHYIRFKLPGGRETGRGPGEGRKSYWLKDGDEVVVLDGRDDAESRRLVDEMTSVARNYLALSDPSRIALVDLALLDAPPPSLPSAFARKEPREKEARELVWLRVASPDFALLGGEPAPRGDQRPVHDVELGIDPTTALPALAIVRPRPSQGALPTTARPMLIRLSKFRDEEGFRLPLTLLVHHLEPGSAPPRFAARPAQEIYVTRAELRPALSAESFLP